MPKSIYKSTNSVQNIILLLLFVVGLFVLYRYVKTIETETKLLQNHLIELTDKIQFLLSNNSHPIQTERSVQQNKHEKDMSVEDQKSNDNMSIQSEDITNMLRKVMGGGDDEVEDDIIANIMVDVNSDDVKNNVQIEELIENEDEEEKAEEDDDDEITIQNKNTEEITSKFLLKKTNEELKTMLKEKALSTKGTKTELVERLLSNM